MSIEIKINKLAKDCAATERRLKRLLRKWKWIATQWGWKFDVNYCMDGLDMPDNATSEAAGYTVTKFEYLDAQIYFNLRKLMGADNDFLEYVVVHELCHLLISPIQMSEGPSREPLEYTATTLARTLISAAQYAK